VDLMKVRCRSIIGALMLGVLVTSAGCSETRGPEVATAKSPAAAEPGGGPAPATPSSKESDYDKALRYTRCMNEHGEKMDDPVEGEHLPIIGSNHAGGGVMQVPEAYEKCKHLMPATWPVKVDPKYIAVQRAYGNCMRQHGIDYPEPDANGMMHYPTDLSTLGRPDYQAADAACRHVIDEAAPTG
jgi:hypothetical protein